MKPFKFFFLTILYFITNLTIGQRILYEYQSGGTMRDFTAIPVGDSILFSFEQQLLNMKMKKMVWVTDSLPILDQIPIEGIIAAENAGPETYLYFLKEKDKSIELKALVLNSVTKERSETSTSLALPGTILGSYIDKNLCLVALSENGTQFSIIEINKLSIVNQKTFTLPVNLFAFDSQGPPDFISEESHTSTFKGTAKVKIFRYDKFYITIDRPYELEKSGTDVITIDPDTERITNVSIPAGTTGEFSSFLVDGKLFRTSIEKKKLSLTVFDALSKGVLARSELSPSNPEFNVYFRYGRRNVIHHKETFSKMMKTSTTCKPSVGVIRNESKYIIIWGTYFNDEERMMPTLTIGGIIATFADALLQPKEGPGLSRYFYYTWDPKHNTFEVTNSSLPFLRQKIDQYEINLHIMHEYKSYIEYKNGLAGIYYDSKAKRVSIVHFK